MYKLSKTLKTPNFPEKPEPNLKSEVLPKKFLEKTPHPENPPHPESSPRPKKDKDLSLDSLVLEHKTQEALAEELKLSILRTGKFKKFKFFAEASLQLERELSFSNLPSEPVESLAQIIENLYETKRDSFYLLYTTKKSLKQVKDSLQKIKEGILDSSFLKTHAHSLRLSRLALKKVELNMKTLSKNLKTFQDKQERRYNLLYKQKKERLKIKDPRFPKKSQEPPPHSSKK